MSRQYILKGHTPVLLEDGDLGAWALWHDKADRRVAHSKFGDIMISTAFIGMDHRFIGEGPPLLFETMVFGGEHDQLQMRYSTWEQAEQGHHDMLMFVTLGHPLPIGDESGTDTE